MLALITSLIRLNKVIALSVDLFMSLVARFPE